MIAYVDDLIVTDEIKCHGELTAFPQQLFPKEDLGGWSYCEGWENSRDRSIGTLNAIQIACVDLLVETFQVTRSTPPPALTPVSSSPKQSEEERCTGPYREAVAGLV